MNTQNIVWTAVAAAALSAISILIAGAYPDLALAIGMAGITNAILATRE